MKNKNEKIILIVEDNEYIRNSLTDFLTKKMPDIHVKASADGKDAQKQIESLHPDLIIMDLEIPDISGLDLTKKAKSINPDTKIIVHTNYDQPLFQQLTMDWGADYFLPKENSSLSQLLQAIKSFL